MLGSDQHEGPARGPLTHSRRRPGQSPQRTGWTALTGRWAVCGHRTTISELRNTRRGYIVSTLTSFPSRKSPYPGNPDGKPAQGEGDRHRHVKRIKTGRSPYRSSGVTLGRIEEPRPEGRGSDLFPVSSGRSAFERSEPEGIHQGGREPRVLGKVHMQRSRCGLLHGMRLGRCPTRDRRSPRK